jgi:hypothetical protein
MKYRRSLELNFIVIGLLRVVEGADLQFWLQLWHILMRLVFEGIFDSSTKYIYFSLNAGCVDTGVSCNIEILRNGVTWITLLH